jgi:cytochrome c556
MKKRIIMTLTALAVAAAVPAMAQQSHEEKTICDLAARNCLNKADILQKRVKKLNTEIKKGTKTYSAEDLKNLEQKLKETQDLLDKIEGKAPAK